MPGLLNDLRFGLRQLKKVPGMALLAIVTLALGVGANTAIFTVIESVLLRPLPYAHPDRLFAVEPAGSKSEIGATSYLNYRDIRTQSHLFEQVAGYSEDVSVIETQDASQSVEAPRVTPNLFSMLGAHALLGRTFTDAEGQTGGAQATILSEGLWREAFHADPGIVGRTIRIGGIGRTVVGVMPESFIFPESMGPDMRKGLWLPLQPSKEMLGDRGYDFFIVLGKVRSGVTQPQLQQEINAIAARIPRDHGEAPLAFRVNSYQEALTGPVRPVLYALLAALGLVLLIACANVSNLLIARCLSRQQEFAVRAALGSGRMRLVRQLLAEGLTLSLFGCGVGVLFAEVGVLAVRKLPEGTLPRADAIAIHWTVVLVLAAIAIFTTVLSSLLPALLAARSHPQAALQAASRGLGSRTLSGRLSRSLVAGEVALSTLLLVGTGLLFHTLWNLERARLGFDAEHVTTFSAMPADAAGFSEMSVSQDTANAPVSVATLVYQPILDRIRHVPGVEDAALVTSPPLSGLGVQSSFDIVGQVRDRSKPMDTLVTAASAGYTAVMDTPIVRGRMIADSDAASTPFVAVVNQAFVKSFFSGQDPLGKQISLGGNDTGMTKPYTIVGVYGDQVERDVSGDVQPIPDSAHAAGSHHFALLPGAFEDCCEFCCEDTQRHPGGRGDASRVSSGRSWVCARQLPNHARGGGKEHFQPAPGPLSGGIVRGPCRDDGDCRSLWRAGAIGQLSSPRNRRTHGAGRHSGKYCRIDSSPGIDFDRRGPDRGASAGFCHRTPGAELSLPGARPRRADLSDRYCRPLPGWNSGLPVACTPSGFHPAS